MIGISIEMLTCQKDKIFLISEQMPSANTILEANGVSAGLSENDG